MKNKKARLRKTYVLFLLALGQFGIAQEITIKGQVLEESKSSPIEYATIAIHSTTDSSLLAGTVTNEGGKFEMTEKVNENYYVAVQFVGFESYHSESLAFGQSRDLGTIQLAANSLTLDEVQITGRALSSLHKIDKQVFSAAQFQNSKGGNASDVIRNLPSVTINSFGQISVRGSSGFLVMINGKPIQGDASVILQQLSANSIEDIEIVTAPSAKYDPDGNAGIINIKTKKAATDGTYVIANLLTGLPSIESYNNTNTATRYGADLSFNYKKGKWDFSAGADYKKYDISGRREGYVNTYINNVLTEFPSDGERSFDEVNYSARAALSYSPSERQTFNVGFYGGKRNKARTADILYLNQQSRTLTDSEFRDTKQYYELYKNSGALSSEGQLLNTVTYFNKNLRIRRSDFLIGSIDYSFTFLDRSQLKVSGLYEKTILGGPTDNANLDYPNVQNVLQLQYNDNQNPLDGYRFQVDYAKTIAKIKWENGYQYRYLNHPGSFEYFDRNLVTNEWVENPLFTNDIRLTREIHSFYSQVAGKFNKLQYVAGLRLENFDRQVDITRPESTFLLDQWNLFPSVNFAYNIDEEFQIKAGYSKRIERTTTFKMTPFPEREHSETLEQGDAELLPEFIDLVEIGAVKNWGDNSVFATAYFRNTKNVINRVNTVYNDTILNRIYTNVGDAVALGIELGTTVFPTEKWRVYFGGNVYNYQIKGDLFGSSINTSNIVYSINANTNFELSPTLTTQLSFNYLSERITAQGEDSEFYNPSLSIRKTFLEKKVAISLQWLNIDMGLWNANEQRITTTGSDYFTTTNYVYEVDILQLNFTYQLNQPSKSVKAPQSEFGKKEF